MITQDQLKDVFDRADKLKHYLQKNRVASRHNIRPIEVKSGENYTLSSLSKCQKKFGEYITTPTVLHAADYKVKDGITYLPLYMTYIAFVPNVYGRCTVSTKAVYVM